MGRRRLTVLVVPLAVVLAACGGPINPTPNLQPTPVPARTSWALSHRVVESDALKITGHNVGHYDEATYVNVGRDANGFDMSCFVTVSAPGQGGPETMIGEKVPIRIKDKPGFRNGDGAEAPYLMWQHDGEAWTMVHCSFESAHFLGRVAEAVQFRASSIRLPFDLDALTRGLRSVQH